MSIDLRKYAGYIGHKMSDLETKRDYGDNGFGHDKRKIVDVKIYKQESPGAFFVLEDGDIISTKMFVGL